VKPSAGLYRISIQYKLLAAKLLKGNGLKQDIQQPLYEMNRAIEVLGNVEIRKYYDLVLNEQNMAMGPHSTVYMAEKYADFIAEFQLRGDQRADRILRVKHCDELVEILQPVFVLFFRSLFKWYSWTYNYGLLGLGFLFLGGREIFHFMMGTEDCFIQLGVLLLVFGIFLLYFNFRQFVIERFTKGNDL